MCLDGGDTTESDQVITDLIKRETLATVSSTFWVIRYRPEGERPYFRVFTRFGLLLTSMSRPPHELHPSWKDDYEIFYINPDNPEIRNVTRYLELAATLHTPNEEDAETAEPAITPHF